MFGDNFPSFSYLDVVMKFIIFRCPYKQAIVCFSGLSLVLKKREYLLADYQTRYTPLVEVNQAILAWSF